MPRNNDLFRYLNSVKKYTIVTATPGDTTTTEAIVGYTVGTETSVDVVASTNFTAADPVMIIGTGGVELATIGTPATTMPVTRPLLVPQASGARMVEAVATDLGHIGPEGVTFGGSSSLTSIFAATARAAVSYFPAPAEMTFTIPLRYKSGLDLQAAFGVPEQETGSGVVGTPWAVHAGQTNIATQTIHCYRLEGVSESGRTVQVDILGARLEVNVADNRGGTDPGVVNIQGKMTGVSQFIWA
jgi:hypothetical protein